jgi:hypothetical protein
VTRRPMALFYVKQQGAGGANDYCKPDAFPPLRNYLQAKCKKVFTVS